MQDGIDKEFESMIDQMYTLLGKMGKPHLGTDPSAGADMLTQMAMSLKGKDPSLDAKLERLEKLNSLQLRIKALESKHTGQGSFKLCNLPIMSSSTMRVGMHLVQAELEDDNKDYQILMHMTVHTMDHLIRIVDALAKGLTGLHKEVEDLKAQLKDRDENSGISST